MFKNEIMWNRWEKNAERYPDKDAIIHWSAEKEPFRWSFSSLMRSAEKYSLLLSEKGRKFGVSSIFSTAAM